MKTDANPSVIFGLYSKPKKKQELLKELKKRGLAVREISFIDVEIPLNKDYDKTINFFKHFIMCNYWVRRDNIFNSFYGKILKQKIADTTGYQYINFKKNDWKPDNKHKLLWTLAVPLFVQNQFDTCSTNQEKINMLKLLKFKSKNYKPKLKGVVKPKDMKIIKNENNK